MYFNIDIFLIFVIICSALSVGIARGTLLDPAKTLVLKLIPQKYTSVEFMIGTLLYCSQCIGFWVGIIIGTILDIKWTGYISGIPYVILSGFISSSFSMILDRFSYGNIGDDYE